MNPQADPAAKEFKQGSRLREARAIIERDFATPLTTQRLARRLRLPRLAFFLAFREIFGQTPDEVLRTCRLQEAVKLLETGLDGETVAMKVGYAGHKQFSADYRREFRNHPDRLHLLRRGDS